MTDIDKQIGNKIRKTRLSKQLTQAKLGELVNLSVESISRLERGAAFPSLKTIKKIADSLDIELKKFFDFTEYNNDISFEKKLEKINDFLKTLNEKELNFAYKILKIIFKMLNEK